MTIPWIPLFPDGSQPVTEVIGYPTSIITSTSGREQRIRLREFPDREFTMRMVEMDARHVSRLLYALEQGHDFNAYVPFWPEAFQLTTAAVATDTTLLTDRTTERLGWFGQFHQVLLWRGQGTYARYAVTAEAGGAIDVDPLNEGWPIGTWVVPMFACKITAIGAIDRATDEAVVIDSMTVRLDWALGRRHNNIMEKWYLRTGPPLDPGGVGATIVPQDLYSLASHLAGLPPGDLRKIGATTQPASSFDLPDAGGVGRLLRQKGAVIGALSAGASSGGTQPTADYICSWVGPPLYGGQAISLSRVQVVYKEVDSLHFSWPVWRMGIWRPGTGVVASWDNFDTYYYASRFFIPLNAYAYNDSLYGNGFVTQDGDRWILGFSIVIQNNTFLGGGFGRFGFDGDTEPVAGTNNAAPGGASYVLIPKMRYMSEVA